jgi:hypothetical protein
MEEGGEKELWVSITIQLLNYEVQMNMIGSSKEQLDAYSSTAVIE